MDQDDLSDKWRDQLLSVEDVVKEVKRIADANSIYLKTEYSKSHDRGAEMIADIIMGICGQYHHPERDMGDFTHAFVTNDFNRYFRKADVLNAKAAVIYYDYFHNYVPPDWRRVCLGAPLPGVDPIYAIEIEMEENGWPDPRIERCKEHDLFFDRKSVDCSECKKRTHCNLFSAHQHREV